jgi:hypothetical protein
LQLRLQKYSFRFAEQVLNSKLALKQEIEEILLNPSINLEELTRPRFNKVLEELFIAKGWTSQPQVFEDEDKLGAKMDF